MIDVDNCLYSEKELRAKCLGTNYYTIEEQIIQNTEKPSFENVIIAMERSGELLDKVNAVFL